MNQQDGSKEILNLANVGAQSRSRNKLPTKYADFGKTANRRAIEEPANEGKG